MSCHLGLLPYLVFCLGLRSTLACLEALGPYLVKFVIFLVSPLLGLQVSFFLGLVKNLCSHFRGMVK